MFGTDRVRKSSRARRWVFWCALTLAVPCARAETRTWTSTSGQTVDAEYISTTISDEALLEQNDGTQVRIPLKNLSADDLDYIALRNPPELKIEFSDSSKVDTLDSSDHFPDLPAVVEETIKFKVRIKQVDTKDYDFGLTVEYYAVGYQYLDHDKYVLLNKGQENFVLGKENNNSFELAIASMKLPLEFDMDSNHYGRKYCAYLVLVSDQRGEVVAYKANKDWLFEHRDKLRELPPGAFMDNTCTRVHPTGPKPNY